MNITPPIEPEFPPASAAENGALAERLEAAGALRIRFAGLQGALQPFTDPGLLAAGKVTVLDLGLLAERIGDRWTMRREDVHDYVDATLFRHLEGRGFHLRISDTDVLVCHPELDRFTGQASSVRYLREILSHFFGEALGAEAMVHRVVRIGEGEVQAEPMRPSGKAPAAFPRRTSSESEGLERTSSVLTSQGGAVRVSCALEPVTELKTFSRIGFRLARRLVRADSGVELTAEAVARLSPADLLDCDLATVARGLDRLETGRPNAREPSLIIPITAGSLSSAAGRSEIVGALEQASAHVKRGVICELRDIDGLPASALSERVALVRPFALLVIGHVRAESAKGLGRLSGAGLQGVSIDCPALDGDASFNLWAKAAVAGARQAAKAVLLYRVPSIRQASLAAVLGATHITLAP